MIARLSNGTPHLVPPLSPIMKLATPLLGVFLYLQVLNNPFLSLGGELTIHNPQVSSESVDWLSLWNLPSPSDQPEQGRYRPVLLSMMRLQYEIWGGSSSSFHALNLVLYIMVLVVFMGLMSRLITHPAGRTVAAFTFVLHPMMTQSVNSVAGQGVLLALLACLGVLLMHYYARAGLMSLRLSALVGAACALVAAGSHEVGLILPIWVVAFMALVQVFPRPRVISVRRFRRIRHLNRPGAAPVEASAWWGATLGPVLLGVALYLGLRWHALGHLFPASSMTDSMPLDGLEGPAWLHAPSVFLAYLDRLIWPTDPTLVYSLRYEPELLMPPFFGWLALGASLLLCFGAVWYAPVLGLALLMMLIPLATLSHWIPLPTFMTEAPLAFAIPGYGLALGFLTEQVMVRRWKKRLSLIRPPLLLGCAGTLVVLAWIAMGAQVLSRNAQWKDIETLWSTEMGRHPNNAVPIVNLIHEYVRQFDEEKGQKLLITARTIALPRELNQITRYQAQLLAETNQAQRLEKLLRGELQSKGRWEKNHLAQLGRYAQDCGLEDLAESLWRLELQRFPTSYPALYGLAGIEHQKGNLLAAARLAEKAQLSVPPYQRADSAVRLGSIYISMGRTRDAIHVFNAALAFNRHHPETYLNLARLHYQHGNSRHAIQLIRQATEMGDFATFRDLVRLRMRIYQDQNQHAQAMGYLMNIARAHPHDVPLNLFAARYFVEHDELWEARRVYRRIVERNGPATTDALAGLARIAIREDDNPDLARRLLQKALAREPDHPESQWLMKILGPASRARPTTVTVTPES